VTRPRPGGGGAGGGEAEAGAAGVLFGLAEIEHEYCQERQAAGIAVAKRQGRYHGRAKGTTKARQARARLLYDRGFTVGEIQQALQISRRTVYRYLAAEGKA
jgi:DNA invertase Pin-like site-specific DNA recombinase